MKLTKSRKICLVLLILAIVGFLMDRLFSGSDTPTPRRAHARPTASRAGQTAQAPPPASAVVFQLSAWPELAGRLNTLVTEADAESVSFRDVFAPTLAWQSRVAPEPVSSPVASDRFALEHRLRSVTLGDNGGTAIINEKVVRIGQTCCGYRLVSLTEKSAVFEKEGQQVRLDLLPTESP